MTAHETLRQSLAAVFMAAIVLLGSTFLAIQVKDSALYRQSQIVSLIVSEDSVGMGQILEKPENAQLLVKFAGAVATAYINFELIPVHEAATFAVVLDCVEDGTRIEQFEYQRRNLVITGTGGELADYERFVENLRAKGYFESVSGDYYLTTDDEIRFKIICVSATADAAAQ